MPQDTELIQFRTEAQDLIGTYNDQSDVRITSRWITIGRWAFLWVAPAGKHG